jgi:hypothetical protein
LLVGILQDAAQKIAEPHDHVHGRIVSFLANESGDCIESIEQKVRLDLLPQCVELRLGELLAETCSFSALPGQPFSRVQHAAGQKDTAVEDQRREKLIVEPVQPESHERRNRRMQVGIERVLQGCHPGGGYQTNRRVCGGVRKPS